MKAVPRYCTVRYNRELPQLFHLVLKSQGSNLSFGQRLLDNGYSGGPENVTIVGLPRNFNFEPNFITFGQLVCKLELFKSEGPGIQGLI